MIESALYAFVTVSWLTSVFRTVRLSRPAPKDQLLPKTDVPLYMDTDYVLYIE